MPLARARRFLAAHPFVLLPPAFYLATIGPTIGYGDTAILIDNIQRGVIDTHVNTHPLTVMLGKIFGLLPAGDLAFRANLVSSTFGAATVIVFYLMLCEELRSKAKAALAGLLLLVAHSMWWHSTIIENYAVSAFLVSLALLFWRRLARTQEDRHLFSLCAVAGLSVANHVQMGFLCVGVLATGLLHAMKSGRAMRVLSGCAAGAALGLSLFAFLFARDWVRLGSFSRAFKNAFFGSFQQIMMQGGVWSSVQELLYEFWLQSPTPYVLLGLVGAIRLAWRERASPALTGMLVFFALNTGFFAFYHTWDKFAFLLISFVVYHFFCGVGLAWLWERVGTTPERRQKLVAALLACAFAGPWLYSHLAAWGSDPKSFWAAKFSNHYSDNLYFQSEFIANPNKRGYREVEAYARDLFAKLPEGAVYLDDDSRSYYQIADYYQRYYAQRPDVATVMVNSWGIDDWGLSGRDLAKLMATAFALNRPFFAATTQSPTAGFIEEARKLAPIDFVEFPMTDGRFIYRMKTQKEIEASTFGADDLARLIGFLPVRLTAPAGYVDFVEKNVVYHMLGRASLQSMASFTGQWRGDDQIFFELGRTGGELALALATDEAALVDLTLRLTGAPDYGDVRIEVEPAGRSAKASLYRAEVTPIDLALGPVVLPKGDSLLRIKIAGKDRRSKGYHVGLDGIEYRRLSVDRPALSDVKVDPVLLEATASIEKALVGPTPLVFKWYEPSGRLMHTSPTVWPAADSKTVSYRLPSWSYKLPDGSWRVEIEVLDAKVGAAGFSLPAVVPAAPQG
jgi:hypothetical protein